MAGWGIIDDLLGAINLLDMLEGWIRGALAGDVAGHRIALPHPESDYWKTRNAQGQTVWTLNEVRRLLSSYHVATYARGFNSGEIWIHVKRKQANWAEYLLACAGAPVIMDTVDPRNQAWATDPRHGGKMPGRWDDRPSIDRRSAAKARRRTARPPGRKA